eukprot:scaffold24174_cov127-Isochrysis_galbana.AAC.10
MAWMSRQTLADRGATRDGCARCGVARRNKREVLGRPQSSPEPTGSHSLPLQACFVISFLGPTG